MKLSTLVKLCLLSAIVTASYKIAWPEFKARGAQWMPVRYVKIEGAFQYISKDKIKILLEPQMRQGFYNVDVQNVHQTIKMLPLADQVDVKRVWPDAIQIKIIEQIPVVRWGEKGLLNYRGELLLPESVDEFQSLPQITGPAGQEKKLLEIMRGLAIVLKDKALELSEFHVSDTRVWKLKLASGMEIQLGRKGALENLQRFLKTADLLGTEQLAQIATVDTRYPNGYAVTWKPDAPAIDWKAVTENNKKKQL